MASVEIIMPKMGESVAEATILKWLKKEGDKVETDESVMEIATDKVDSEIPSPVAGILTKQLFAEGQIVKVGTVIALIETDVSAKLQPPPAPKVLLSEPTESKEIVVPSVPVSSKTEINTPVKTQPIHTNGKRFYSPLVRAIAQEEGVSFEELERIPGSGNEGRVTKNDLLNYLPKRNTPLNPLSRGESLSTSKSENPPTPPQGRESNSTLSQPVSPTLSQPVTVSQSMNGETEIIEMDRMRKLIAEHMVMSKHVSPHVTSYVEVDVTNMVMWRAKMKDSFEKREKEKLTFTPLFIEAVVKALKDYPMVNVSVDGTKIILKKYLNIGMATALPSGNLIVPVIKNADRLSLFGLTKSVNDLANRARNNKLLPDEIQGGTFTVTNVGTFGNTMGTPIINQPQVAILATGSIKKKPAVIETLSGDSIGIRHMMFLSLSYDHRVVDGALGGSFLRRIADYLEKFDSDRTI